jgi:hypothetical protein
MKKNKQTKQKKLSSLIWPLMMIILTFALLYMSIPKFYDYMNKKEHQNKINQLTESLIEASDYQAVIEHFAIINQAFVRLNNNTTNQVFETSTVSFLNYHDLSTDYKNENEESFILNIRFSQDNTAHLQKILALILPVFALCSLILTFIFYKVKSEDVSDLINDMEKATNNMIKLKPNAKYQTNELDPKHQTIANNINEIYSELLFSISILENKIEDNTKFEQAILSILKKTSDRVTAPIEEIKKIVNGMIHNVGVYKNHQIYLIETSMKLNELSTWIKDELSNPLITNYQTDTITPFDVKKFFDQLIAPYQLMSLTKNLVITNQINKSFDLSFNPLLFPKAINHILNYAFQHTQEKSEITILNKGYNIIIEYKSELLSSIDALSELSISDDLSLATKLLYQLKIPFNFEANKDSETMQFIIQF